MTLYFQSDTLKGKRHENLIKSDFQRVRGFFSYFLFFLYFFLLMQLYLQDETFTQHTELLRILYLRLHFCYYTTIVYKCHKSLIKLRLVAYIALFLQITLT